MPFIDVPGTAVARRPLSWRLVNNFQSLVSWISVKQLIGLLHSLDAQLFCEFPPLFSTSIRIRRLIRCNLLATCLISSRCLEFWVFHFWNSLLLALEIVDIALDDWCFSFEIMRRLWSNKKHLFFIKDFFRLRAGWIVLVRVDERRTRSFVTLRPTPTCCEWKITVTYTGLWLLLLLTILSCFVSLYLSHICYNYDSNE